jgi:hypothetical protein
MEMLASFCGVGIKLFRSLPSLYCIIHEAWHGRQRALPGKGRKIYPAVRVRSDIDFVLRGVVNIYV